VKKIILVGMVILLILVTSCSGKTSQSISENSDDGKVSVVTALKAFQQTKKVDGEVVPDVEAIARAIQGLDISAVTELTEKNASPISNFLYDLTSNGKGIAIREYKGKDAVLIVPATIEGFPIVEIHDDAFRLTDSVGVVLPNTVVKIGGTNRMISGTNVKVSVNRVFSMRLVAINFPSDLKEIGSKAFSFTSLISAHLPEGVEKIDAEGFENCRSLKSVTFPSSIKEIGESAFYYCSSLTSAHLPDGLSKLGSSAFSQCRSLSSVSISSSLKLIPSLAFSRTRITELIIPEGVEIIDEWAFSECYSLQSVSLPSTIKEIHGGEIGSGAFKECTNLTDIIIPDSVRSIAFRQKSSRNISKYVFEGCGKLKLSVRQRLKELGYNGEF
jgi:hypothetical protein